MGTSIGLIEVKSIPIGMKTADEMLKAADVSLLLASPICPGKYVIIINGNVGAVKSSMATGRAVAESYLVTEHTINNAHESIPSAVLGTTEVEKIGALGIIETISALTAVRAGDIAAKASNIKLMEIRIARGLGGKGYILFTGDIAAVRSAVKACLADLGGTGEIISHATIAQPHAGLIEHLQ